MLELTIRDPNSLLPIVFRAEINHEQLEAIRKIVEKTPIAYLVEKKRGDVVPNSRR
jgi:hypothetical protein